jgi:hypothetical protein
VLVHGDELAEGARRELGRQDSVGGMITGKGAVGFIGGFAEGQGFGLGKQVGD